MLKGNVVDGLYLINPCWLSHGTVGLISHRASSNLWHARISHTHARILKLLSTSLPHFNKILAFFESCTLGKSLKLPFSFHQTYAFTFLHTTHNDVWGPASASSYENFRYYLLIIDEYSRFIHFIWFFTMARKSDALTIFPSFLNLMENQFNTKVKLHKVIEVEDFLIMF